MNLSRRGLWLAAGVLLLGVVSQWLPDGDGAAWRALAALWVLAIALEGWWTHLWRIETQWNIPNPLRLGRPALASITLSTRDVRPLTADVFLIPPSGVDVQPQHQRIFIDRQGCELTQSWTPTQLGALRNPVLQLRLLGGFGLVWWSRRLPCTLSAPRVEPDLLNNDNPLAGRRSGMAVPMRARGAGTELLGLRDYTTSDPMRALAWKASARRGRPLVREFVQEQQLDLMIIIDAGRAGRQQIGSLTRLHHAANASARLAQRACTFGDRVGLIVYNGRGVCAMLTPTAGLAGLRRLRHELAALAAQADDADPLSAALALRRHCPHRALALWFTDVDTGASAEPLQRCAQLLVPRHLPLFAGLVDRDVVALAEREPRSWKDPYIALAAAQSIDAAELQARTLRRMGCIVVQTPPQETDARLLSRYESLRARRTI